MKTQKKRCADGETRVIGYVRCSTQKQADSGLGMAAQARQLKSECERRTWCLKEIVTDSGKTAKNMSREGMQRALAALNAGEADVLMVPKQDRATRSVRDLYDLMDASSRGGWALVDLETGMDTCDPTKRMIAGMRGVVSQWEREMIALRTRDALAEKKAAGIKLGRPVILPDATANHVRLLREQGNSIRRIADLLNDEGVPTASGRRWYATSVQRILDRGSRLINDEGEKERET